MPVTVVMEDTELAAAMSMPTSGVCRKVGAMADHTEKMKAKQANTMTSSHEFRDVRPAHGLTSPPAATMAISSAWSMRMQKTVSRRPITTMARHTHQTPCQLPVALRMNA